jgi:AbrB family looped-hinge helix DNA binding protein
MVSMKPEFTTVSSKGQLVIPACARRQLGIKAGTRVAVRVDGARLILQPITEAYIESLRGIVKNGDALVRQLRRDHETEDKG